MKKFNKDYELKNLKSEKDFNTSKLSSMYVPILVGACSCLALVGVTFSSKLVSDTKDRYNISIEILGDGDSKSYEKVVKEGPFRDKLDTKSSFGSISCVKGNVTYDPLTHTISSPYINNDVSCIISFKDDKAKEVNIEGLYKVNDNYGVSSYYKADSENNYMMFNDMLFRIVRFNGDGTIRLMLNDTLLNSKYDGESFYESSLSKVLGDWFDANFANNPYTVSEDFDTNRYEPYEPGNLVNMEGFTLSKVGLLSVVEADLISKDVKDNNYLNNLDGMYLGNQSGINMAYSFKDGKISLVDKNTLLTVKPVINIKNVELKGSGTINNPYTIDEAE